mmetsp:Transcript_28591/g.66458  ORF Transcript_28591/g.66458 Transcript_28591/m.66458 type:complete len:220 (-) Transcript_28591:47-706(-)
MQEVLPQPNKVPKAFFGIRSQLQGFLKREIEFDILIQSMLKIHQFVETISQGHFLLRNVFVRGDIGHFHGCVDTILDRTFLKFFVGNLIKDCPPDLEVSPFRFPVSRVENLVDIDSTLHHVLTLVFGFSRSLFTGVFYRLHLPENTRPREATRLRGMRPCHDELFLVIFLQIAVQIHITRFKDLENLFLGREIDLTQHKEWEFLLHFIVLLVFIVDNFP